MISGDKYTKVNTTKNTFYLQKGSLLTACFGVSRPLSSNGNKTLDKTYAMRYGQIDTKFTYVVCKKNTYNQTIIEIIKLLKVVYYMLKY
jgi:hypothetical protein